MTSPWEDFLSLMKDVLAKGFIVAACACFALALVAAAPVLAQTCPPVNLGDTCPVTATVNIETGLRHLAFVELLRDHETGIFWGDGTQSDADLRCYEPVKHPHECHVFGTHTYAMAGIYTITISYVAPGDFFHPGGTRETVTTTANISPAGDLVILSIGDSVASGEGNPVVPFGGDVGSDPNYGFWDDAYSNDISSPFPNNEIVEWPRQSFPCHRSSLAGPSQAAQEIQARNPGVTFIHYACSGAKISAEDTPKDNVQDAVGQLRVARMSLPRIDILIISAGTNSFHGPSFGNGFGELFTHCIKDGGSCSTDPQFITDVNSSLQALPSEYAKLAQEINCIDPHDGAQESSCTDPQKQIPKLVLITEYMDPTHDQNGNYSSRLGCPADLFKLVGITASEWKFFHDSIVHPLNQQVDNFPVDALSAGLTVPTYAVTGIEQDFLRHGLCAGDQRWVLTLSDSESALGPDTPTPPTETNAKKNGTGHPNAAGQTDYRDRIYAAIINYNPPVTTASATAGDSAYGFGTWTDQNVDVTLSANNGIKEAGVKQTFYAVDSHNCDFADVSGNPSNPPNCLVYGGPFTISSQGKHTVTFFSLNAQAHPEALQTAQVWIDKNGPLTAAPGSQVTRRGGHAPYNVTLGHVGWPADAIVSLSCTTDAPLATCSVIPNSVPLDAADGSTAATATVYTSVRGMATAPGRSARPTPFGPLVAVRFLLALATALLLVGMALATRRRRWAHVGSFAALVILSGLLFVGCADGQSGTPSGRYNVTITGTSGGTSHTSTAVLFVH